MSQITDLILDWNAIAERSIDGEAPSREEAAAVLQSPESEFLGILHAAYRVRRHFFGNKVHVHVLQNALSGLCPEDCAFCSQATNADTGVDRYKLQSREELVAAARQAKESGAFRYCMVTATRGPNDAQLDQLCEVVREINDTVGIRVCTSLGILTREQAVQLKEAGVDRFNHNLETSRRHFPSICSTHTYEDRVRTIEYVHEAGIEACCGGIVGMGETDEDILDLAFEFRRLGVESIPINFLDPRPGTPLGDLPLKDPRAALRVLCLVRLVNPSADVRVAGGREVTLRTLQPMSLYPCNSLFTNGYLTTDGNCDHEDVRMIRDLGFEMEIE